MTPAAWEILGSAAWPAGLRELDSLAEQVAVAAAGQEVSGETLAALIQQLSPEARANDADIPTLFEAEGALIRRALEETGGNKVKTARLLGITRTRLYRKIAEHQLDALLGS